MDTEKSLVETIDQMQKNPSFIKTYLDNMVPSALHFVFQLVIAILILLIGGRLIKSIVRMMEKSLRRGKTEAGVVSFLCSFVRYVLYFVLVMVILAQFGVTTSSVVAVLGSAGLTLGLALQGSLANFAGGVLILLLKPFVVGDYIEERSSGQEGTVSEITIFYTKLLSIDNKMIVIPNGSLSNTTITNFSHMEKRRIDLLISVAYDSDLKKVKQVLQQVAEQEPSVKQDEPIDIYVSKLADSCVEMGFRVWVKNEEYWPVRWRLLETIKGALAENGISIPFPQLDVNVKS